MKIKQITNTKIKTNYYQVKYRNTKFRYLVSNNFIGNDDYLHIAPAYAGDKFAPYVYSKKNIHSFVMMHKGKDIDLIFDDFIRYVQHKSLCSPLAAKFAVIAGYLFEHKELPESWLKL